MSIESTAASSVPVEVIPAAATPVETAAPATDFVATSFAEMLSKELSGKKIEAGGVLISEEPKPDEPEKIEPADPVKGADGLVVETAPETSKEGSISDSDLDKVESKMDLKSGTAFKFVRGELKAERDARTALEAKVQELEAKTAQVEDSTALKAKLDAYEKELSVVNVQATEDFKVKVELPLSQAINTVRAFAQKYGISEEDVRAALSEPDPLNRTDSLAELSSNFNRFDLNRFDKALGDIFDLEATRASILSNAQEAMIQLNQQKQSAAASEQAQRKTALAEALNQTHEEVSTQLKAINLPDWDKQAASIKDTVSKSDLFALGPKDLSTLAYRAAGFDTTVKMLESISKENSELKALNGRLKGASPSAAAGAPAQSTPADDPNMTFADAVKARMGRRG